MDLADKLGGMLLARLGSTPEQAREWVSGIVAKVVETHDQVMGARLGFGQGVQHFDDRLDAIEARLESIAAALRLDIEDELAKRKLANGSDDHA